MKKLKPHAVDWEQIERFVASSRGLQTIALVRAEWRRLPVEHTATIESSKNYVEAKVGTIGWVLDYKDPGPRS